MQINNKEYEVLENAWNIISNLNNNSIADYENYLNNGNPPDETFEKKISNLTRMEWDIRKFLKNVDVVG